MIEPSLLALMILNVKTTSSLPPMAAMSIMEMIEMFDETRPHNQDVKPFISCAADWLPLHVNDFIYSDDVCFKAREHICM